MKKLLIFVSVLLLCVKSYADSPITSTEFALAYRDVPIVNMMLNLKGEVVSDELIEYLADEKNPIDVKVAAINAVSFNRDVYAPLMQRLKIKYGTTSELTVLSEIDFSTHVALAYARARHYYMDLREAYVLLASAFLKNSNSFTANMVYALVATTDVMEKDFCQVYQICASIVADTTLVQDMRPQAVPMIMEYINEYAKYCK